MIVNDVRTILKLSKDPLAIKIDPIQALLDTDSLNNIIKSTGAVIHDEACVQPTLADICVSTAKEYKLAKDSIGVCLMYRALERNTLSVGMSSKFCPERVINQELNAISQHQDPAFKGAQANNANIESAVAKEMVKLGFSIDSAISLAHRTGTFAAGDPSDKSGRGNSCDSIPSFKDFGKPVAVPEVFATEDGTKEGKPISGVAFGRKITAGQLIDCTTLAELTNSTVGRIVPATKREELTSMLKAAFPPQGSTPAPPPSPAPAAPEVFSPPTDPASVAPPAPAPESIDFLPIKEGVKVPEAMVDPYNYKTIGGSNVEITSTRAPLSIATRRTAFSPFPIGIDLV